MARYELSPSNLARITSTSEGPVLPGEFFPSDGNYNDARFGNGTAKIATQASSTDTGQSVTRLVNLSYAVSQAHVVYDLSSIPSDETIVSATMRMMVSSNSANIAATRTQYLVVKANPNLAKAAGAAWAASDWWGPAAFNAAAKIAEVTVPANASAARLGLVGGDALATYLNSRRSAGKAGFTYGSQDWSVGRAPTAGLGLMQNPDIFSPSWIYAQLHIETVPNVIMADVAEASVSVPGGATVSLRRLDASGNTIALGYSGLTQGTGWTKIADLSATAWRKGSSGTSFALVADDTGNVYVIGSLAANKGRLGVQRFLRQGATTNQWTAGPVRSGGTDVAAGRTIDGISAAYWAGSPGYIFVVAGVEGNTSADTSSFGAMWATLSLSYIDTGNGASLYAKTGVNSSMFGPAATMKSEARMTKHGGRLRAFRLRKGAQRIVLSVPHATPILSIGSDGAPRVHVTGIQTPSASADVPPSTIAGYPGVGPRDKVAIVELQAGVFAGIYRSPTWVYGGVSPAKDVVYVSNLRYNATEERLVFEGSDRRLPAEWFSGARNGESWDAAFLESRGVTRVYFASSIADRRIGYVDIGISGSPGAEGILINTLGAASSSNDLLRAPSNGADERRVYLEVGNRSGAARTTLSVDDLSTNLPPYPPTIRHVADFDSATVATFAWTFADPNTQDTQSAYDLEIRRSEDDVIVVNTGKVTSSVSERVIAAGTLVNGVAYRWRVRTYDVVGNAGDWSAFDAFSTTSVGTLTITSPAADYPVLEDSKLDVSWAFSQGQGAVQVRRRVRALVAGTGAVAYDSTMESSTETTHTVTGLATETDYNIEVTITTSQGGGTAMAIRRVKPDYTAPEDPIVSLRLADNGVDVAISNPVSESSARPLVVRNLIYRAEINRADPLGEKFVLVGQCGNNETYHDRAVRSEGYYRYFVKGESV